jgi:methylaspartate ammonia-lyase
VRIKDVILSKAYTGFFFDDQKAIKTGAKKDGLFYVGEPMIEGFTSIRQKGEAISVQLILENDDFGIGECAAVQYSGTGGRDPLFLADDYIPFLEEEIVPLLIGEELTDFKELAEKYDRLQIHGKRLHTAIRYGLTQALLSTFSAYKKVTMAEIIRESYQIKDDVYQAVPIFTQSGDERYDGVDKMILKEADVIPHGLINNIDEKLGRQGELLKAYVEWMRNRVLKYRVREDYLPVIHIDVYGTIGIAFDNDMVKIIEYLIELEETAKPLIIRVEGPIDAGNKEDTIMYLSKITAILEEKNSKLEIVADEWCNTLEDIKDFADAKAGHMLQIKTPDLGGVNNIVEAILYCNEKRIGSYSGGTCNETNISAQITTNIAIACKANQMLAKPGMGVDEGYMIVKNEMNRVLAKANRKRG